MSKVKFDNPMSRQVYSLPELIEDQYEDLEPKARKVLSFEEIFNIQKIVITGAGDSLAAGEATKEVFEQLTGIPTEVVKVIDLARFYPEQQLGTDSQNPLIISVSNSGSGARVSEAVQRAKKHGAYVLGVTGNLESDLGEYSDKVLELDIPDFESAPGTRSYVVSLIALLLLAIRFGEVRGNYTMDQAMDYRYDIKNQGENLKDVLDVMNEKAVEVSKKWSEFPYFEFIGAGTDYASAWFGHAKFLEANGKISTHINSEEWFHINFFARDVENIGTFVFASEENGAMSRNKELIHYNNVMGRPLVIFTNGTPETFDNEEGIYIQVPSAKYAFNNVLTNIAPICLIASYIAELNNEEYGRGTKGKWEFADDGFGVKNSEIEIL